MAEELTQYNEETGYQEEYVPSESSNCASQVLGLMQSASNLYAECKLVEERTEQIKLWGEVKIAETVAKYRSCQEFLSFTFGERDKALSKHYDLLDKAVNDGDKELIVAALKGISGIVTSSPLSDFKEFVKLYEDTTQPLLDF